MESWAVDNIQVANGPTFPQHERGKEPVHRGEKGQPQEDIARKRLQPARGITRPVLEES